MASGKSGPVGLHVLSVVVMDKGQGHEYVQTRRHCMVVKNVLAIIQK